MMSNTENEYVLISEIGFQQSKRRKICYTY